MSELRNEVHNLFKSSEKSERDLLSDVLSPIDYSIKSKTGLLCCPPKSMNQNLSHTDQLPVGIREQVLQFPEWSMGAHRVTVVLADGRNFVGTFVAWGSQVVKVEGFEVPPFDASQVVEVFDASQV